MIFKKSSFSNGSGGSNCAEVAVDQDGCYVVRDSKQNGLSDQPMLCFRPAEWAAFVAGVKAGEFD